MSLLFGSKKNVASQVPKILSALSVQTSSYGQVVPIVYGQQRVPGKLIWYGDFTPIPSTSTSSAGGKGLSAGSTKQTTYTYRAAVAIMLCEGQIVALVNVWDTKGNLALASTTQNFTVPGGGGTFTAVPPGSGVYFGDVGVNRADAYSVSANDFGSDGAITLAGTQKTPMTRVAGAPAAAGQYQNTGGTSYVFHASDGGKQMTITYVYSIPDSTSTGQPLQQLSLTLFTGSRPQTPWAFLTSNHPGQDLPYAGIAYVAASQMDLGSSGSIPNFSYEVAGLLPFGGGIVDAEPGDVIADLLTNPFYGAGSEDNLVLDPAILSSGPAGNGKYWTQSDSFFLRGKGTLFYVGTGAASGFRFGWTQPISVTPGQQYTLQGFIDATNCSVNAPGWFLFDPTISTNYFSLGIANGTKGFVSGVWTCPGGVTQVVVLCDTSNTVVANGQLLRFSQPLFVLGTAIKAQIQIDDYSNFSAYCIANGIFLSPLLDSQVAASQAIDDIADLANGAACWSEGIVKLKSYGDTTAIANGTTFTPPTTPIYDLTDTAFINKGGDPVTITRKAKADTYNNVKVEFVNRANSYNVEIAEDKDDANIFLYGLKAANPRQAHSITDSTVAKKVANQQRLRAVYIDGGNSYKFTLGWQYGLLEPMDLVTLTDVNLGLIKHPVRITNIKENNSGELDFTAEEFPWGNANPTAYPYIGSSGFAPNQEVDPGNVNAPIIFLAPNRATGGHQPGYEIWIALSGVIVANWGGCRVWISTDNATFSEIGRVFGPCRMGVLTSTFASGSDPDTTHTLAVDLTESAGVINPGSSSDADQFHTLCYVDGEFIAYSAATLTSAFHYNLATYIRRGIFNTPISSHAIGSSFVRLSNHSDASIDEPIFIYQFDPSLLGKSLFFKFTSFNKTQKREQPLSSVSSFGFSLPNLSVPTGLTAIAEALGVRLTWNEFIGQAPVTTYNVYRNTSNSFAGSTKIASVPSNTVGSQTYFDKSASVDVLLFYWVTAVSSGNSIESGPSAVASNAGIGPGTHSSYRPTTNPLTSVDAGASATVNVASFNMQIGGKLVSYNSFALTSLSYNTLYYIYLTDPGFAGGSPTYNATTSRSNAINAYGQLFVGSIKTAQAGGSQTTGNNDGGAGAQIGGTFAMLPSIYMVGGSLGDNTWWASGSAYTNHNTALTPSGYDTFTRKAIDGDTSTGGTVPVANITPGQNTLIKFGGFPSFSYNWQSLTLKIKYTVTSTATADASDSFQVVYTLDSFTTTLSLLNLSGPSLNQSGVLAVSIPVTTGTGAIIVEIVLLTSISHAVGQLTATIYEIWLEGQL